MIPAIDYAIEQLRKAIDAETKNPTTRSSTLAAMGLALGALMSASPDDGEPPPLPETFADTLDWAALAEAVRHRRLWLGMSQGELRRRGGPSDQTVSRIETQRRCNYSPAVLAALEKGLRWPPGTVQAILTRKIGDRQPIITAAEPQERNEQ